MAEDIDKAREEILKAVVPDAVRHAVEITEVPRRSDHFHNRIIVGLFVIILALVGFGIWNHVQNYVPLNSCPSGSSWVLVRPNPHVTWQLCQVNTPTPSVKPSVKASHKVHRKAR